MERIEGLTMEQANEVKASAIAEGYKETQSIENVPVGAVEGQPELMNVRDGKKTIKSPNFAIIPFTRKNKQGEELKLFFEGVKYDVTHLSTGKSFNGIFVKATDELKDALSNAVNYTKSTQFDSVAYTDGQGRNRTILKYQSIG